MGSRTTAKRYCSNSDECGKSTMDTTDIYGSVQHGAHVDNVDVISKTQSCTP